MKKLRFLFLIILCLFLCSCTNNDYLNEVMDAFVNTLPYELKEDLKIESTFSFNGQNYNVFVTSKTPETITNDGKIKRTFIEKQGILKIKIVDEKKYLERDVTFLITKLSASEIADYIANLFNFYDEIKNDLNLPNTLEINGEVATLTWNSSNESILSNTGKVNRTINNSSVQLTFLFNHPNYKFSYTYTLNIASLNNEEKIDYVINLINIPNETKNDLKLIKSLYGVSITWKSSNEDILTKEGSYQYPDNDTLVELTATFKYENFIKEKKYNILVKALSNKEKLDLVLNDINLPNTVLADLNLNTNFSFGIVGSWKSLNEDVITSDGKVTLQPTSQKVTLILKLTLGDETMEKEFTLTTASYVDNHIKVDYAKDFLSSNLVDLEYVDGKIVLKDGKLEGYYESEIYKTRNFTSLVGSWAAISNTQATAELQVRVRVNGTWSKYFSYGTFGLGLQNKMIDQSDINAKLDDDIIVINSGKYADAFQYKIILRRTSETVESAKLSLVAITLQIPNYTYPVDISNLPKKVEYDLPNLYQVDVPEIGNIICSPTSATMILMYYGHKFTDEYPHREVAKLFYDHGNKIYGNWVFNTVGMSAYGEDTYVKRIYSLEELIYHLATVGPVALSIKGNTGRYNTNGHLLVVSGYEITDTTRYILVHDPYLKEVEYKYSEDIFNQVSRNVIYVIEPKVKK